MIPLILVAMAEHETLFLAVAAVVTTNILVVSAALSAGLGD